MGIVWRINKMKRSSFFTKLFIGSLVLIAVIIAIFAMVSYRYLNSDYQKQMALDQRRAAGMMKQYFQQLWPGDSGEIDQECKTLFQNQPMRLTIIALDGTVLGDSQVDPSTMAKHLPDEHRPEIKLAIENSKTGMDKRTSITTLIEYRYIAEPILIDGKIAGVARIAMPVREMADRSNLIRNSLLWAAMIGFAVAAILALLASWIWFSPLKQITGAAREIASGNIDHRVNVTGTQEMVQLGKALNDMASNLSGKIAEITTHQNNLNTVLDNLSEGVVAIDSQACVVFMNASANILLDAGQDTTTGKQLQQVVRIADVISACKDAMESRECVTMQFEHNVAGSIKTLKLNAVQIPGASSEQIRAILVIRDITIEAQTARMKNEFVANASHELRTPLATIRAAVDSLEYPSAGDKLQFDKIRDILDRQTTQLQELTNDLLSLHKISREGDELIDNAIKFTPDSGTVKCSIDLTADNLKLKISDTGCGISPEHQGKVFERFFQVESAKSGPAKTRGTGLGLAIVKHASERLGGVVNLKSKPGNGTTVEVNLPHAN